MFRRIGGFSIRFRWAVIGLWLAVAVLMALFAPEVSKVGITDQEAFLPIDAPSVRAGELLFEKFPTEEATADSIVFLRETGLTESDLAYAQQVQAWLQSAEAPPEVSDVLSVFSNPELKPMLMSEDGTTMLMSVGFSTSVSSEPTSRAVGEIREGLPSPPSGLEVYTAGSASIVHDTLETVKRSLDRTTWATVLLVIVVLLLIYRSPVASLVPLVTISVAYLISKGVLGYLAQAGLKLSTQMDIFAIVVVFGVGTDYCLFIVSRYREEMYKLPTRFEAGVRTMEKIGAVIAASATVVIMGFLFLNVANFGQTRTLGTGLAVAIFVTLLAGLTLTPALMFAMGDRLFWPFAHAQRRPEHGLWHRVATWVSRHAAWVTVVVILALLLPYVALPRMVRSFDVLADIPPDMDSARGFEALRGHFNPGELLPTTVMLVAEDGQIEDHLSDIAETAETLRNVEGVALVRSIVTPTGDPEQAELFLVDGQLSLMSAELSTAISALASGDLGGESGVDPAAALKAIRLYLADLGAAYPELKGQETYTAAVETTRRASAALAQATSATRVTTQLETIAVQVGALAQALRSPLIAAAPGALEEQAGSLDTLATYLEGLGQQFPFLSGEVSYSGAVDQLNALRDSLEQLQKGMFVSGQLDIIAQSLDDMAAQLDNPLAIAGMDAQQDFSVLQDYLALLAEEYPMVNSEDAYLSAQEHFGKIAVLAAQLQSGQVAMADLPATVANLQSELRAMAANLRELSAVFAEQEPAATLALEQLPSGMLGPRQVAAQVETLGLHLLDLVKVFETRQPDAQYLAAGLAGGPDMTQLAARLLGDLRALSLQLADLSGTFQGREAYFYPESLLPLMAGAGDLERAFFSEDGTATRLYVVLEPEPYSNEALDVSVDVRAAAEEVAQASGMQAYVSGSSIAFADIREISEQDFYKVLLLTVAGVFVVMVLLLRSLVAPTYLVLTVLLSYGSTLSLTVLLFQLLLGHGGVNLLLPTMVLVLLLALGADYNIFLMARVREETADKDFVEGLVHATSRTGAIITSCGIVLAGTFATMMLSPMMMLLQIGASVAFGVLLDTFVIRGILVPAIARLLKRWNWWPSKG